MVCSLALMVRALAIIVREIVPETDEENRRKPTEGLAAMAQEVDSDDVSE